MNDFVTCPLCEAQKKNLTKHMMMAHGYANRSEILEDFPGLKLIADSTSQKISDSLRYNWATDPYYAERCSTYWRSELHAQRKSRDMKKLWEDKYDLMHKGVTDYARSEKGRDTRSRTAVRLASFPKTVKHNDDYYRSSLEVDFVSLFEEMGLNFEYETIILEYFDSKNNKHRYLLDFYFPDFNTIVEVKPKCFVHTLDNGKSKSAFESQYRYVILTEDDLSVEAIKTKLSETEEK